MIGDGVIACREGMIVYAGPRYGAPQFTAGEVVDCGGRWITPGLIDCHTHLIHAGDRAHEFELRLAGTSYQQIARMGGGIVSTMSATRNATEDELVQAALSRLDALLAEGVTTLEIKSGYGLSLEAEARWLRNRSLPAGVSLYALAQKIALVGSVLEMGDVPFTAGAPAGRRSMKN